MLQEVGPVAFGSNLPVHPCDIRAATLFYAASTCCYLAGDLNLRILMQPEPQFHFFKFNAASSPAPAFTLSSVASM